jgi:hypothetical protein
MDDIFDGRDSRDGILGENAEFQGKSAGEFAVQVHRAAAHAGDHAGALDFGTFELDKDDGLARPEEIRHYVDDFEIESFDLIPGENCEGITLHARTNLIERQDFIRLGRGTDW